MQESTGIMASTSEERRTAVVYDERLHSHYSQWNEEFTEKPLRTIQILRRCSELKLLERCLRIPVREATTGEIFTYHTKAHLSLLESTANMDEEELKKISRKYDYIYFHKNSAGNAKLVLGGVIDLVDAIAAGKVSNGMAIVRPPGHHAMKQEFCGYCYFGNVAIAAQLAMEKHHMKRILVLDWDVHHGQGTQYMFYDDPRVLFVSIHRYEHGREWPNLREGDYDFTGEGAGKGYNINVPLNEIGCDNSDYLGIIFNLLLPIFYQFNPELVLVSAGYDCAIGCPEGEMCVTPACFPHLVNLLKPLAKGKLGLILEGGYNIKSLAESAALSLRALLNDPAPVISPIAAPKHSVTESVLNCIKVMHQYWSCLQYQDFVEPHKVKAETYPYQGVLHLPPVQDVEFCTSQNRPEMFPLYQDCTSDAPVQTQEYWNSLIDQLVQGTSLDVPNHRLGYTCESGSSSAIINHLKSRELFKSCHQLQDTPQPSASASASIKKSLDSLFSNEVQCCLCCLQSSSCPPTLNGKPVNGTPHSDLNLVKIVEHQAGDSQPLKRILIIDLNPEPSSQEVISKESTSLCYLSLRMTDQEGVEPHVSQRAVDIPLTQGIGAADFLHVFLQVILPLAYEFYPELLILKLNDMELLSECMGRACFGHLTQLLLGLAGGKMLVLTSDWGEGEIRHKAGSPSSKSRSEKVAADSACGDMGERKDVEGRLVVDLVEEWAEIVLGAPCKDFPAGLPSSSTVTSIKKIQDKLKESWSVFKFRIPLPIISL